MTTLNNYEVIVVGGSYAGLSAALVLGRSLRRVLVIDAGQPCNRQTPHSHGFLTRDGATPAELTAIAREQLSHYPTVQFLSDTVLTARQAADGFIVTTASERSFWSRKLLLATGLVDILPDIPGFAACWGRSILHCPYCHGYEVHGQHLGLLANGETAYELTTLIHHWSQQLTLFTNGPSTLSADHRQTLDQLGISVVQTPISHIEHTSGTLTALLLSDGSRVYPKALFTRVPVRQSTDLAKQLGCAETKQGFIEAAESGETTVPSVYATGDTVTPYRQVAAAVAGGAKVAAWINRTLIQEALHQQLTATTKA